jgi:TonB family protein
VRFSRLSITIAFVALTDRSLVAAEQVSIPKTAQAIYAAKPKYPLFALLRQEEGGGIFVLRVNVKSGRVKQIIVAQSTGHKDLDAAAVKSLKQWRFKPGATPSIKRIEPYSKDPLAAEDGLVKCPVTFTIR